MRIVLILSEASNKYTFCRNTGFRMLDRFPSIVRDVMVRASTLNVSVNICYHHEEVMSKRYTLFQNISLLEQID